MDANYKLVNTKCVDARAELMRRARVTEEQRDRLEGDKLELPAAAAAAVVVVVVVRKEGGMRHR